MSVLYARSYDLPHPKDYLEEEDITTRICIGNKPPSPLWYQETDFKGAVGVSKVLSQEDTTEETLSDAGEGGEKEVVDDSSDNDGDSTAEDNGGNEEDVPGDFPGGADDGDAEEEESDDDFDFGEEEDDSDVSDDDDDDNDEDVEEEEEVEVIPKRVNTRSGVRTMTTRGRMPKHSEPETDHGDGDLDPDSITKNATSVAATCKGKQRLEETGENDEPSAKKQKVEDKDDTN